MSARLRRARRKREPGSPSVAVARPTRRGLLAKLARVVGVRRRIVVEGVRYTERSPRRPSENDALQPTWEVRFPSGEAMLIHPSERRVFPDLDPTALRPTHRLLRGRVRPGMRVLDASCGTGAGADLLADWVGPSGAVVALGQDEQAVEYARRRYPAPFAAFELGGIETLSGEVAGAFHAVVAPRPVIRGVAAERDADQQRLAELWRVVAPSGSLLVELDAPSPNDTTQDLVTDVCGVPFENAAGPSDPHAALLMTRPGEPDPEPDFEEGPRPDDWRHTG
ncbi:MAG: methyltransferase domain-containing protein [Planctomycetota bacterium]